MTTGSIPCRLGSGNSRWNILKITQVVCRRRARCPHQRHPNHPALRLNPLPEILLLIRLGRWHNGFIRIQIFHTDPKRLSDPAKGLASGLGLSIFDSFNGLRVDRLAHVGQGSRQVIDGKRPVLTDPPNSGTDLLSGDIRN